MSLSDDLAALDAANKTLQADRNAAKSTKAFGAAATAVLHDLAGGPPTPPPPPEPGGVGLYQLGGSLPLCSHLADGTYRTVIGDWDDADLLAKVSGIGFVYTVTAATAPPSGFTTLDTANPQAYVDAVVAYQRLHGFRGVFLDNCDASVPGLGAALAVVGPALRAAGVQFAANLGDFISGDSGSDDGTLWMQWASACAPFIDYGMCENWQQVPDNGTAYAGKLRTSGSAWYQNWDGWQRCPAVLGSKFMGVTYGPPAANAVYGRASLLTAPGGGGVFVYSTPHADPYDSTWAKQNPSPSVNPAAGTATL